MGLFDDALKSVAHAKNLEAQEAEKRAADDRFDTADRYAAEFAKLAISKGFPSVPVKRTKAASFGWVIQLHRDEWSAGTIVVLADGSWMHGARTDRTSFGKTTSTYAPRKDESGVGLVSSEWIKESFEDMVKHYMRFV